MDENIKVYVKVDSNNVIIEIGSSLFIQNLTGWIQIDEGQGDKYAHADNNYLDEHLMDTSRKYNYKLENGKAVLLTQEEKNKLYPNTTPSLTLSEKNRADIEYIALMTGVIL